MIIVDRLAKKFNGKTILENVNLKMEKGKIYGFVGKNGSGKTVLFKMILGFMAPSDGYVEVNNKKVGKDIDFPANCGIIIETPGFIDNISGYKNLKLLANIRGNIDDSRIRECMKFLGLDPDDKKKVKNYSLGMKQKLGLVQALMENPEILVLDEPMNALEEESVVKLRNLLMELKQEKIILLASHIKEDIELLCDEIYEIKDKTVKQILS